jgi:outer membrane murein-binding lipoprotein Lpp
MSSQGDFFPQHQNADAASMMALMEMIRAQTVSVERNNEKVDRLSSSVAQVREDIAVLKSESHRDATLAAKVTTLENEVTALKMRNAQQDGGFRLATVVKDFSPWIVTAIMAALAFFKV